MFEYLKQHARGEGRRGDVARGSVEQGLAQAPRKFQATYHVAYVQHAPMEPRAAVAEWQDGRLTVWTGTSNPFGVRQALAEAFQVAPERVRVIVPDMGGGFGGKHTGEAALEAARLAKEAGRPVALQWTRAEEFTWAYFRPAALIEVEAGLDARQARHRVGFHQLQFGRRRRSDTPYRIANTRARFIESDSPLRQGSYRCLAATANNFAREAFTDELAEAAGKDPLEFRLAHLDNERIKNVLTAAAERFGWAERQKEAPAGRRHRPGLRHREEFRGGGLLPRWRWTGQAGRPGWSRSSRPSNAGPIIEPANLRSQVEGCITDGAGSGAARGDPVQGRPHHQREIRRLTACRASGTCPRST